jgi:hypothetical protein
MKQFGFLAVFPLAACRRLDVRALVLATLVTLAVNLPFFLWDPSGFKLGLIDALSQAPLRTDSVALSPMLSAIYNIQLPTVFGFFAAIGTLVLVQWRADGSLARASAGGAATCLAFFLFGRAGHLNYYWFCGALLWLAVMLAFAEAALSGGASARTDRISPACPALSDTRIGSSGRGSQRFLACFATSFPSANEKSSKRAMNGSVQPLMA